MAEERLDRRKHSSSAELPKNSITAVIDIAGIEPSEIGAVGISYTNVVIGSILEQLAPEIRDYLSLPYLVVYGLGHHDCHAWSAYCTSDSARALILVADGAGDIVDRQIESESLYFGENGQIRLLERRLQDFGQTRTTRRNAFNLAYMSEVDRQKQISLGRKYEQFTYLVGFAHGEAGKTMALAAYAEPLFRQAPPRFSGLGFSLTFQDGLLELEEAWRASGEPWHRFVHDRAASIAAAGQALIETNVLRILQTIDAEPYGGALCAAGGLFLSCRLNHRILTETDFKHLHVIPAAGDDGQCVGAAFAAYAKTFGQPRCSSSTLPYLGRRYRLAEIAERLKQFHLKAELVDDVLLIKRIAADLAAGEIVAILRGRSEIGPRALCHRSLLADPRDSNMKERLNKLKGREQFRPFGPVVTADEQFRYFELAQESPYMLLATQVRTQHRQKLPAITHVDGTARVQAVSREQDHFTYDLLRVFEELTGFPIILNTSFNLAGDPIVESPHDAIVTFLAAEIDVLVLENYYISKRDESPDSGDVRTRA